MIRLTPEWTEVHARLVGALTVALLGVGTSAWADPLAGVLVVVVVFALTYGVSLAYDPMVGVVTGLAGAALLVLGRQTLGLWDEGTFAESVLEVALVLLTAVVAGYAGVGLRESRREAGAGPSAQGDLVHSANLLRPDTGELRLEEEAERALLHGRSLSLLRIETSVREDVSLDEAERKSVYRAVARLVESMLRPTDVPFAYGDNCVLAILSETGSEEALSLLTPLIDGITRATFVVRPTGDRRALREYADVRFAVATLSDQTTTAAGLLKATQEALSAEEQGTWSPQGLEGPGARGTLEAAHPNVPVVLHSDEAEDILPDSGAEQPRRDASPRSRPEPS